MDVKDDPLAIVQEIRFDDSNKWYMHNPEYILENKTKSDHIIPD